MAARTAVAQPQRDGLLEREAFSAVRFPRIIKRPEIESLPRMVFAEGCGTGVFLSPERDDTRYFMQGLCFHSAQHGEYSWIQDGWDEAYYCVKGVIRVGVQDGAGNEITLDIQEGEHMYLPAGFTYTLKPSGVDSINFWTVGAVPGPGIKVFKEIGVENAAEVAKQLRELRQDVRP